MLQLCGFSSSEILAIAEVNTEKFGRLTPGTHIPIISDEEAKKWTLIIFQFCHGILKRVSYEKKNNILLEEENLFFLFR